VKKPECPVLPTTDVVGPPTEVVGPHGVLYLILMGSGVSKELIQHIFGTQR